jgi:hypothetical protein
MKSCLRLTQILALLSFMSALSHAAEPPATFKVSDFTFERPPEWEWVPTTSPMRKAELKVVSPKGDGAVEVVFFHFGPGDGGGTQANVDRWFRMFKEPRDQIQAHTEKTKVDRHEVTYVRAQGTYLSGMPGGPQTPLPDHGLIGAIIEAPGGNVFVRLTGPKALASAAETEFKAMIASALR